MKFDLKELRKLVSLVEEANISEITLEDKEGEKVCIKKGGGYDVAAQPIVQLQPQTQPQQAIAPTQAADSEQVKVEDTSNNVDVVSPMVGTFYAAANPDSAPYVKVGDRVNKGDTLCIVEAMKLFNEIEAEISGTITEVLLNNATPVEYGQVLIKMKPA